MKAIKEDVWKRTVCGGCYAQCAIRVHVVDGVVVNIGGDPDSVMGAQGGVCGKAAALIQELYHPNRFNYPLKRTGPKGIGVDPKWKRISWDEALGETAERLKKIRSEDPDKFAVVHGPGRYSMKVAAGIKIFGLTLGLPTDLCHMGVHCGWASHLGAGMNHCSWSILPDFRYSNYVVYFGSNKGVGSGHSMGITARLSAEARARGMRTVAFDPMCNFSGGKATEWVPILPGTDLAVALAMANVIVNELGMYDAEFLVKHANGGYLVKPDGHYARDEEEPLLWDIAEGRAKKWNETIKDAALEGTYEVEGVRCQTVFSLLREHLKQYTPEWAAGISMVPAHTIRRIATEFATEARIGSTIEIQGIKLPYRPVAAIQFRGGQGHSNGFHTYQSVDLLNHLVGCCEMPGGAIGWAVRSLGHPQYGNPKFSPVVAKDGFMRLSSWMPGVPGAWPHPEPKEPKTRQLRELLTCSVLMPIGCQSDSEETLRKFGHGFYEACLMDSVNPLMSTVDPELMMDRFKRMFVAAIAILPNETTEAAADIIFPDTCILERTDFANGEAFHFNYPMGLLDWEYHPVLPVVEPTYERKMSGDILIELAERTGMREEFNRAYIGYVGSTGCPPPFDPKEKLSWVEITDRVLQARFGKEHDLEWFKGHGFIRWPKKVEEAYWRPFVRARSSVYNEWLIDYGKQVREISERHDFHLDWAHYTPFLSYLPAAVHKTKDPKYDLIAYSYRDILHSGTSHGDFPWIIEASNMNPYTFEVCMNAGAAKEKGLKDGDMVYIENEIGRRIKVKIHAIQAVHPQCIGIAYGGGHWLEGHPIKGRGGHFNTLLVTDLAHHCPITQNIETAVRVRIYKAED